MVLSPFKNQVWLTCGVLPDLFVTVLHLKAMPGLLPLPAQLQIALPQYSQQLTIVMPTGLVLRASGFR